MEVQFYCYEEWAFFLKLALPLDDLDVRGAPHALRARGPAGRGRRALPLEAAARDEAAGREVHPGDFGPAGDELLEQRDLQDDVPRAHAAEVPEGRDRLPAAARVVAPGGGGSPWPCGTRHAGWACSARSKTIATAPGSAPRARN